ncbi:MAG: YifB family Mg chelatase-like AAA ATPase [Endomicrobiia bacterium]|nr:YifB family Mg chelatase-like AAA ATPase [Endomicrobiia bacterium]
MLSKIFSCAVEGIDGYLVTVEVDMAPGFPVFATVGLPDAAVRESKERVTAALRNSGFGFPVRKITVNLAPASIKKEGAIFDLPIALGILAAEGALSGGSSSLSLENVAVIGELALDGRLRPVRGVLPMALALKKRGIESFVVPAANAAEAALVEDIKIIGAESLREVAEFLRGEKSIEPTPRRGFSRVAPEGEYDIDFSEIKGQSYAKRAAEVAVAGGHNMLMIGPPGSGKTMIARRIAGILPPPSYDEAVEVTKIHSVSGHLSREGLIQARPFRSPHHTVSDAALIGGGQNPRPGEVSLAHRGVLFLDELPEFDRNVLEAIRQPLEDRRVTIARAKNTLSFPASFMLIAAMNPCPCGNYGHPEKECVCTPWSIRKYLAKISGPLLDRIDIHVEVPALKASEMPALNSQDSSGTPATESSSNIRLRVERAREIQFRRNGAHSQTNASLSPRGLKKHCRLSGDCKNLLLAAVEKLGLSARGCDKVVKVARTIADLSVSGDIEPSHIAEAVSYRSLDKFVV